MVTRFVCKGTFSVYIPDHNSTNVYHPSYRHILAGHQDLLQCFEMKKVR